MLIGGVAWLRTIAVWARHTLALSAGVGVAVVAFACWSIPAEGETGPPSTSDATLCPSPNPPNQLTLIAGTPQTVTLGSAFATNLQVAFTNSNGCPVTSAVTGDPVTFSAPSAGASGLFSASSANAVTVGSDASGMASAPTFTADSTVGSYTVTASSAYGSIAFSLTNVEAGDSSACGAVASSTPPTADAPPDFDERPTKLSVGVGATQSVSAGARFPIRLAVTVTDAEKDPVPGALVTFAAPDRGPSGYFTVRSGGADLPASPAPHAAPSGLPASHRRLVEVSTDGCGIALAPPFTANRRDGGYVVLASVEHVRAAFALVNEGR